MERVRSHGYLSRPRPSGLADVLEIILDKGIVVDAYARVSLLGIEILTIDARIAIASVDTDLRFAEATNRVDLAEHGRSVVDLLDSGVEAGVQSVATEVAGSKVEGVLDKVGEALGRPAQDVTRAAGEKVVELVEGSSRSHTASGQGA